MLHRVPATAYVLCATLPRLQYYGRTRRALIRHALCLQVICTYLEEFPRCFSLLHLILLYLL